jgi:glutathione S-transferase
MQLYDFVLSGNSYKVRLFAALLEVELELVPIDVGAGENRSEEYLKINPRGQVPVLVDDGITIWDSQAILVYLARRYGDEHWLPSAALDMAQVMQWMALAQNELLFGLARARAVKRFGRQWDLKQCQDFGRAGLEVLDAHLGNRSWLAAGRPTIADVACYPYVALAPEAEIPLEDYANVCAWLSRVQELPGYISMPGIEPVGGEA